MMMTMTMMIIMITIIIMIIIMILYQKPTEFSYSKVIIDDNNGL